jgi:hypothetical protein
MLKVLLASSSALTNKAIGSFQEAKYLLNHCSKMSYSPVLLQILSKISRGKLQKSDVNVQL